MQHRLRPYVVWSLPFVVAGAGYAVYFALPLISRPPNAGLYEAIYTDGSPARADDFAWVRRVADTLAEVNEDPWLRERDNEYGPAGALMMARQHDLAWRAIWGIHAPETEIFPVRTPRATYYMNRDGEFLFRADPGYDVTSPFSEGVAAMGTVHPTVDPDSHSAQFEYVDLQGQNAVPGYYAEARPFKEGIAVAGKLDADGERRLGMIDRSGNWIVAPRFDALFEFVDGLAAAQISKPDHTAETAGFIDRTGEFVVEFGGVRRMLSSHHDGLALVWRTEDPAYVFVDRSGQVVLAPDYEQVEPFYEGRAAVMKGNVWGFIDTQGEEAVPLKYWMVTPFEGGIASGILDSPALHQSLRRLHFVIEE